MLWRSSLFCGFAEELPPQASLVGLASSPKGTPLRYAGNFSATAKSRPLGEGGIAAGDDGRGTPGQAGFHFSWKPSRHAKGSLSEGAGKAVRL